VAGRALGLLLVSALATGACSGREPAPEPEAARPLVGGVKTQVIGPRAVPDALEAVGTVRSVRQSVLSSKLVAAVTAVRVREGDHVTAGQALVTLDDRDGRAQLARAEAGLREARDGLAEAERALASAREGVVAATARRDLALATLNRYEMLRERRSVAPQEFDEVAARHVAATADAAAAEHARAGREAGWRQAAARIQEADAEVARATIVVGDATIRAPRAGLVVSKTAEVGNLAAPGLPLLTIDEERYRLEAVVGESGIGRIVPGRTATVVLDSPPRSLDGRVAEIVPLADPASRSVIVKIDLPVVPGLRTGAFGRARFAVGERRALLVPARALVERGQLTSVWVVDANGIARLRLVTVGRREPDGAEVLSGLVPGERIVTEGAERVTDGSRVREG
jgi:multidrug efflux pump subunit AcrA (membrane-fusion protein)